MDNENGGAPGAMRNLDNHEAYNIIDGLTKDGKIENEG